MRLIQKLRNKLLSRNDSQKILSGKIMARLNSSKTKIHSLEEVEFKVFSQWGDDGIIQYLIQHVAIESNTFVEFGVEDYYESNTRFLLINNNWSGLVIDGSPKNIENIKSQDVYWKYDLNAVCAFITRDNINQLIKQNLGEGEIGILSIDIDGNDYWVLDSISIVKPVILITEYNSVFGNDRSISIPYKEDFIRTKAHYSNLYWGASLPAFHFWASNNGYTLIGCNSNGNNAYFVRNDKVGALPTPGLEEAYVASKHRESRDENGRLSFLSGKQRLALIKGKQVINVQTGEPESL